MNFECIPSYILAVHDTRPFMLEKNMKGMELVGLGRRSIQHNIRTYSGLQRKPLIAMDLSLSRGDLNFCILYTPLQLQVAAGMKRMKYKVENKNKENLSEDVAY